MNLTMYISRFYIVESIVLHIGLILQHLRYANICTISMRVDTHDKYMIITCLYI